MVWTVYDVAKTTTKLGGGMALLALLGLYYYQNSLIYPASLNDGHGYCATPDEYGIPYEAIKLTTSDVQTIRTKQYSYFPLMQGTLATVYPSLQSFTKSSVIMYLYTATEGTDIQLVHQVRWV